MLHLKSLLFAVSLCGAIAFGIAFAAENDDAKTVKQAEKQLANLALQTYELRLKRYSIDPDHRVTFDELYTWSKRAMEAESGLKEAFVPGEAADAHLARMTDLEKFAIGLRDAQQIGPWDVTAASYYRLEAEIWAGRFEK